MPTPILYHHSSIDPFAHLSPGHKSTKTHIFYATNRLPELSDGEVTYGNKVDSVVNLGRAIIRMGEPGSSWLDLKRSSLSNTETDLIPIVLETVTELAKLPKNIGEYDNNLTSQQQQFVDSINTELKSALDKEIMIYVNGTKVSFADSAILTAEVDHFAGRDFIGLAFAWPSHQNIASYLFGFDVRRARDASESLVNLLLLLSEHTTAKHINILSYSAGGKVASKALYELRQKFKNLTADELKEKLNIGSVIFAAIDVEVEIFLERLTSISELANQVVLTVTDNDNALNSAKFFMGGSVRVGSAEAKKTEDKFIVSHHLSNVEVIDVSAGKEERGFDIDGHHYWYRHPWMSSDIIFLMRTGLPASRRGLSPTETKGIWFLSKDYPETIKLITKKELSGQWRIKSNNALRETESPPEL